MDENGYADMEAVAAVVGGEDGNIPTGSSNISPEVDHSESAGGGSSIPFFSIFFHAFFKVVALFVYIFCSLLFPDDSFVVGFILIVVIQSIDFWVTKNITGRRLAGLRWWQRVRKNGTTLWRFEYAANREKYRLWIVAYFWLTFVAVVVLWVLLGVVAVFQILTAYWVVVVLFSVFMNLINMGMYAWCYRGQTRAIRDQIKDQATAYATSTATAYMKDALNQEVEKRTIF